MGAFFWGYSGYSYSGLGITEYTEFQFRKERSDMFQIENRIGGDLRTAIYLCMHFDGGRVGFAAKNNYPKRMLIQRLSSLSKPHSFHSVHSAIRGRMNRMIFRSFRKRNSSQKNTNTIHSEYSYSGIVPKECTLYIFKSE